jgi:hypothetical protein
MELLSNVHKRHLVPLQLKKIEEINPGNWSQMVPIAIGLRLEPYAKFNPPSTLSFNS